MHNNLAREKYVLPNRSWRFLAVARSQRRCLYVIALVPNSSCPQFVGNMASCLRLQTFANYSSNGDETIKVWHKWGTILTLKGNALNFQFVSSLCCTFISFLIKAKVYRKNLYLWCKSCSNLQPHQGGFWCSTFFMTNFTQWHESSFQEPLINWITHFSLVVPLWWRRPTVCIWCHLRILCRDWSLFPEEKNAYFCCKVRNLNMDVY